MAKSKSNGNARKSNRKQEAVHKRELIFKEVGQEYAQVTKMLGNCRVQAYCFDGVSRICQIRGNMRKKVYIAVSDIVLVGLRDYQNDRADVILKYLPEEARLLTSYGELPATVKLNDTRTAEQDDDIPFKFTEDISDSDEDEDSEHDGESDETTDKSTGTGTSTEKRTGTGTSTEKTDKSGKQSEKTAKMQSKKFSKPNRPRELSVVESDNSEVDLDAL